MQTRAHTTIQINRVRKIWVVLWALWILNFNPTKIFNQSWRNLVEACLLSTLLHENIELWQYNKKIGG